MEEMTNQVVETEVIDEIDTNEDIEISFEDEIDESTEEVEEVETVETTEEEPQEPPKKKVPLTFNKQTIEVDEEELPNLAQAGLYVNEHKKDVQELKELKKVLKEAGYEGENPIKELFAHLKGTTVEEYEAEQQRYDQELNERFENDPRYQMALQAQQEAMYQRDLAEIKRHFPFEKATHITQIANFELFNKWMSKGNATPVEVYELVNKIQKKPIDDKSHLTVVEKSSAPQKVVMPSNVLRDYLRSGFSKEEAMKDFKERVIKKGH
jgi:hypothetical protein